MWLLLPPLAAVLFGSYAFANVLKSRPRIELIPGDGEKDAKEDSIELGVVVADPEQQAGDVVVSDILEWLEEATDRLELTKAELMAVHNSTFLKFKSRNVELNLWMAGETYLGPFPRLCVSGETKTPGISIPRTALDLERAILDIRGK
jgi:hypothetical protein